MLTLAEIKSINITENKCEVHIPIFDVPGTFNKTILTAVINITPGVHSGYEVGDTVIVSFVDETINKPIVLGKLYLGVGEEVSNRGIVSCDRLEVGQQATIPVTTELTFTGEPDTFIGVEGGYSSYRSILDIIDVLHTHTLNINNINRSVGSDVDLRSAEARALALRTEDLADRTDEKLKQIRDSFAEVETTTKESIAGAKAEVEERLQQVNGSVAEVRDIVTTHSTEITNITTWQSGTSDALSAVENKTTEHEAEFTALATWKNDTTNSITEVKETADAAKAELLLIADWQEDTNESIAAISQIAEAAKATTEILTAWCEDGETLETKLTQLATQDFVGTQISAVKDDINAEFILGVLENDSGSMESFASLVADKIEFEGQELNIKVPATNIVGNLVIGQLPSSVAQTSDIPSESEIVTIAQGAITADHVSALECEFTKGKIGNWCFESDGTLRSAESIYGTYTYSAKSNNNSGLSNLVVINPTQQVGYAFTALLPEGLAYVIKETNSYTSNTKVIIPSSALTSFTPSTSSGGGGSVLM